MPCLQNVILKTYQHPIDMTTFTTEDREDAERKPMNANEIANAGIVTQLAVVHNMLPKIKELIDHQQAEIEELKKRNLFLESIYRTIKVQER